MRFFQFWLTQARHWGTAVPTAFALSTVGKNGCPSCRMMLLKGADQSGFTFYTNYESRKGQELAANPRAAMVFFWGEIWRQVRAEGIVEVLPDGESDQYFRSRARGSRLGAWASRQSHPIQNRAAFRVRLDETKKRFSHKDVPRPDFWGGYRLKPDTIEFWQGRPHRLHDRFVYTRQDGNWTIQRLMP